MKEVSEGAEEGMSVLVVSVDLLNGRRSGEK